MPNWEEVLGLHDRQDFLVHALGSLSKAERLVRGELVRRDFSFDVRRGRSTSTRTACTSRTGLSLIVFPSISQHRRARKVTVLTPSEPESFTAKRDVIVVVETINVQTSLPQDVPLLLLAS